MERFNVILTPDTLVIKDYRTNKIVEKSLKTVPPSVLISVKYSLENATILKSSFKPDYMARNIITESGTAFDRWVKRSS